MHNIKTCSAYTLDHYLFNGPSYSVDTDMQGVPYVFAQNEFNSIRCENKRENWKIEMDLSAD